MTCENHDHSGHSHKSHNGMGSWKKELIIAVLSISLTMGIAKVWMHFFPEKKVDIQAHP